MMFYEAILGDKLQIDFGYNSDEVAYFFAIFSISAFLMASLLILFPLKYRFPEWAALALLIGVVALILMGPCSWIGLPDNQIIIASGFFLLSIANQLLRVSSLVLITNSMMKAFPGQIHQISKLLGTYNELIIGCSFFLTPLYSSGIYKALGYEYVCNILGIVVLVYLAIFLFVAFPGS